MENDPLIRKDYLDRIAAVSGDRDKVTAVTGMRGVGKTTIMGQYADRLVSEGKSRDDIFEFDFDSVAFFNVRGAEDLKPLVMKSVEGHNDPYVILDEVQKIPGWDEALAAMVDLQVAVFFITASDDSVLSPRSSELKQRLQEVRVYPLSLDDFTHLNNIETRSDALRLYLEYGGMPAVRTGMPEGQIKALLRGGITDSVLRDGLGNGPRLDPDTAMLAVEHILDTAGMPQASDELLSASGKKFGSVSRILKSMEGTYLAYTDDGRTWLKKSQILYYASDVGLRNSIRDVSRDMKREAENAVFSELKRRGCRVTFEDFSGNLAFKADYGNRTVIYFVSDLEISAPEPAKKSFWSKVRSIGSDNVRITLDGTSGEGFLSLGDFLLGTDV